MPRRPKQHQLEDISRAKFQLCLPQNWVYRNKDKDYGIDGEVELFDDSGMSQGLIFYVQLKATNSVDDLQVLNVNFKIDTLRYFSQLDLPVLLVRYSAHQDKFYVQWINSFDFTFIKKEAKNVKIKLKISSEWKNTTASDIEKDLNNLRLIKHGRFAFPLFYNLNVSDKSINGVSNEIFKVQIHNELKKFQVLKLNNKSSLIEVLLENGVLSIHFGILKSVHFHSLMSRPKEDFLTTVSYDIILGTSMCLILCGYIDYGARMIFENNLQDYLLQKEEFFINVLPYLLESVFFKETLKLVNQIVFKSENEILLFPSILNALSETSKDNKRKNKHLEKFFVTYLKKAKLTKINTLIASSHYNLGNFYRSRGNFLKALSEYNSAKRFDSSYLKRGYFYREFAGLCFLLEKYNFSVNFYKKAIKIDPSNPTKALLADSLLLSGKYYEAKLMFEEYFKEDFADDEFVLKHLLLERAIEITGNISQQRKVIEARKLADISKLSSKEDMEVSLKQAINMDMLSDLAWFNYGHLNFISKEYEKSTFSYAFCAILNTADIEAWVVSFISFLNSREIEPAVGVLILRVAYLYHNEDLLIHLYQILEDNNLEVLKMKDFIVNALQDVKRDDPTFIRFYQKDVVNEVKLK